MKVENLSTYELIEKHSIEELDSVAYLLKHKKSGARIALLSNDDENKVFNIGFRTPPQDSTGLPHILEHSVLCGSKKFPVKDPFVELVKGSLNTFLNAMTYSDKTVYPVASCNDADFQNLMDVYLDAVFHPNIYDKEEIFRQEGWHYELEDADGELTLNGVVYNEMKGAFSSPEDVLEREIMAALFPDTPYGNESGGDPDVIPELTLEQFLDFHKKYYHPSNSYIYLYGNMDMVEKLQWLDEEYLSAYDKIEIDSALPMQEAFDETREVILEYPISEAEEEQDNTYLSFNKVIGTSLDKELYLAFQVIEYALLAAPGAPLKQAILDAKIGKDVMSSYDNGIMQPIFSIIAKNANTDQKDAFVTLIYQTLENIVNKGLDKKALEAGLNYYEFRYREADFGNYPKGLMYGLQAFDSWLYDENKPFIHLEALDTFASLRKRVDTDYFEKLIQEYLLDNTHAAVVVVEPKKGLAQKKEEELAKKLADYKASLTTEECEKLASFTKHLKEYQEEESPQEDLEKIPVLKLEDIDKNVRPFKNEELTISDTKVIFHEYHTNGIVYVNMAFDITKLPKELLPYASILKNVLGYVDTENYTFGELFNEINRKSGGISSTLGIYANDTDEDKNLATYELRAKALEDQMSFVFSMVEEILTRSKIDDEKRLYEIIAQLKSRLQMALPSHGHSTAVTRATSYFSETSDFSDRTGGIGFYRVVEELESNFAEKKETLIAKLKETCEYIFCPENLLVSVTGERKALTSLEAPLKVLQSCLKPAKEVKTEEKPVLVKKNEGFLTSSQVQYVAVAGNFKKAGLDYTGALRVLKVILSYDYLWLNVRVKGGAYGCMSGFTRTGNGYLASYRDPNLRGTFDVYRGTVDYLKNFAASDRDMLKYIIGTISDMDIPLTPSMAGQRSFTAYLTGVTEERILKEREEVLSCTVADIRKLADYIQAILDENAICVLGNEALLKKEEDLFDTLKPLFQA
ncbi:MAG: insulinase family protein [Lachnospiraceae bacterium]|nr:insulinase family protein [Lachnospiraceae bacterium]